MATPDRVHRLRHMGDLTLTVTGCGLQPILDSEPTDCKQRGAGHYATTNLSQTTWKAIDLLRRIGLGECSHDLCVDHGKSVGATGCSDGKPYFIARAQTRWRWLMVSRNQPHSPGLDVACATCCRAHSQTTSHRAGRFATAG